MLRTICRLFVGSALAAVIGIAADAAAPDQARNQPAIDRIKAENPGAKVSVNPATGTARFVRLGPTSSLRLGAVTAQSKKDATAAFVNRHAAALGLRTGSAELALRKTESDRQGQTHLTYTQQYAGLPVFGAVLKVHFDAGGRLSVVNGTLIPDIDVSAAPSRSAQDAEAAAVSFVKGKALSARGSRLLMFREGLAKGVPGDNHLALSRSRSETAPMCANSSMSTPTPARSSTGSPARRMGSIGARMTAMDPDRARPELSRRARSGSRVDPFPTGTTRGRQHDPGLGGDLRPLLQCLRPRFLRRRRRHDGLDLQPWLQLSERVLERGVHLVLPGHRPPTT